MADGEPFEIVRLGAQGDGMAETAEGARFVPFALPTEKWREVAGAGFERLSDAPERVGAPCCHFTRCGGCVAQHMNGALYVSWKSGLIRQALAHQGIDIEPKPMWRAPPGSRRRLVFSAEGGGADVRIGFRAARSHDLVEVSECIVADERIVSLLPALRGVLMVMADGDLLPAQSRVHVLKADNGIDVLIEAAGTALPAKLREQLAAIAQRSGILRLRVGDTEIFQGAHPVLKIGDCDVRVPAGVFVQAVRDAEVAMAAMIVKALGRARHVADLFCGLGTFTLPLAKRARILAVDNQTEAIAALGDAVRHTQGLKPIECLRRDLFREPLSRNELKPFDGVVFDPPRAGAAAQAEAIARSKVGHVVAVSCNPATLARDLRIIIDGGYSLESVTPLDQFLYSAHIEAVAVLRR